jgi:hypothetical protein
MSAPAIVTLVAAGLVLAAVAALVLTVIAVLGGVLRTLGRIEAAVRVVAQRTADVGPALEDVNADLAAMSDRFDRLVGADTSKRMTVGGW